MVLRSAFGLWPPLCRGPETVTFLRGECVGPTLNLQPAGTVTSLCPAPPFVRHLPLSGTSFCPAPPFVRLIAVCYHTTS